MIKRHYNEGRSAEGLVDIDVLVNNQDENELILFILSTSPK
jgi:hypothetical protein